MDLVRTSEHVIIFTVDIIFLGYVLDITTMLRQLAQSIVYIFASNLCRSWTAQTKLIDGNTYNITIVKGMPINIDSTNTRVWGNNPSTAVYINGGKQCLTGPGW